MKKSRFTLKRYNFAVQLIMVVSLALILGTFGIYFSIHDGSVQRDLNLRNAAESAARMGQILNDAGKTPEAILTMPTDKAYLIRPGEKARLVQKIVPYSTVSDFQPV